MAWPVLLVLAVVAAPVIPAILPVPLTLIVIFVAAVVAVLVVQILSALPLELVVLAVLALVVLLLVPTSASGTSCASDTTSCCGTSSNGTLQSVRADCLMSCTHSFQESLRRCRVDDLAGAIGASSGGSASDTSNTASPTHANSNICCCCCCSTRCTDIVSTATRTSSPCSTSTSSTAAGTY